MTLEPKARHSIMPTSRSFRTIRASSAALPISSPGWRPSPSPIAAFHDRAGRRRHPAAGLCPPRHGELPGPHRLDPVHVFFGDERCVPPDDCAATSAWRVRRCSTTYRWRRATSIASAGRTIRRWRRWPASKRCCGCSAPRRPLPSTSSAWAWANGHTASLFPGTAALREAGAVGRAAVRRGDGDVARVTFTTALINAARNVAFLVEGAGKAEMLWNVEGPDQGDGRPADSSFSREWSTASGWYGGGAAGSSPTNRLLTEHGPLLVDRSCFLPAAVGRCYH